MAKRVALNVSLTAELTSFVRGQVAAGAYGSASEVVRAGLRLLIEAGAFDTGAAGPLNHQETGHR